MNIYVGNLSPEVKEEELSELFSQQSKVLNHLIHLNLRERRLL